MIKRLLRSVAVIAVLATGAGLLAVPANATATTHHTVAQAQAYIVGKWTSGPNTYTKWQRVQITGSHKDPCFNFWDIDDVMHQYVNPLAVTNGTTATSTVKSDATVNSCPVAATIDGKRVPLSMVSWWNPFSWDWGHILSASWNTIWNNCLSGATAGLVGTASGTTIINLLARGGKVFVGPYGYAAIAIGGCVVQMLW